MRSIQPFIDRLLAWAAPRVDIRAIALVGSHTRHAAHDDSDIDLVLLIAGHDRYLHDSGWLAAT